MRVMAGSILARRLSARSARVSNSPRWTNAARGRNSRTFGAESSKLGRGMLILDNLAKVMPLTELRKFGGFYWRVPARCIVWQFKVQRAAFKGNVLHSINKLFDKRFFNCNFL
jgi:hypothetical protein